MDSTPRSWRCAKPHSTNHSTDRYTASQLVWKARAVSRQLSRRAQRAKNPIMAQVTGRLPLLQGMCSTTTPVVGTLHPPWRVEKVGRNSPQGHKQPAPFRQAIIAWCRSLTLRAAPAHPPMWFHRDPDRERSSLVRMYTHLLVDEAHETLHPIQNGLNLKLNS